MTALVGSVGQLLLLSSYYMYAYKQWINLWGVRIIAASNAFTVVCMLSANGSGVVHYPVKSQRTFFISLDSFLMNVGGMSGAIIALAMNAHETSSDAVVALSSSSYLTMVCVCGCSILFALGLVSPSKVVRKDGSHGDFPTVEVRSEMKKIARGATDL